MAGGERISNEVAKELSNRKVFYCRLSIDHGLEDIGFGGLEKTWRRQDAYAKVP